MKPLKLTFEIEELAGCLIEREGEVVKWEDLTRKEQIRVCNSLLQFAQLYYKFIKENDESE